MAASLSILTGQPSAFLKSNPTQPRPRLCGSATGLPWSTGPGYPMDATEYSQPGMAFRMAVTILAGVIFGPEGISTRVLCPVARTLTWVPPTSRTRILSGELVTCYSVSRASPPAHSPLLPGPRPLAEIGGRPALLHGDVGAPDLMTGKVIDAVVEHATHAF